MSPETNRANAQHSTGPVTDAGKQTVSRNALKHGLTGKTHAALPGEESAFEQHCAAYRKAYAPVGIIEEDLVRTIAENQWRLRRAHALEEALFDRAIESGEPSTPTDVAGAWVDPRQGFQRIALYAARIQRSLDRQVASLKLIQDQRKAAYAAAREEAILLTALAHSQHNAFDPADHFGPPETCGGFVYSADEIKRLIIHRARLEQARALGQ